MITARTPVPVELVQFVERRTRCSRSRSRSRRPSTRCSTCAPSAARRPRQHPRVAVRGHYRLAAGGQRRRPGDQRHQPKSRSRIRSRACWSACSRPRRSYTTPQLFQAPPLAPNDTCPGCTAYYRHFRPTGRHDLHEHRGVQRHRRAVNSAYTFADVARRPRHLDPAQPTPQASRPRSASRRRPTSTRRSPTSA